MLNAGEICKHSYFVNSGILRSFNINDNIVEHVLQFACEGVWIHQDAWFYMSDFDANFSKKLSLQKEGNGFYIMNIEGEIEVNGEKLEKRDAIGIWKTKELQIKANTNAKFLIMEISMVL